MRPARFCGRAILLVLVLLVTSGASGRGPFAPIGEAIESLFGKPGGRAKPRRVRPYKPRMVLPDPAPVPMLRPDGPAQPAGTGNAGSAPPAARAPIRPDLLPPSAILYPTPLPMPALRPEPRQPAPVPPAPPGQQQPETPPKPGEPAAVPVPPVIAQPEPLPPPPFEPLITQINCARALNGAGAAFEPAQPIQDEGGCGDTHPVTLNAAGTLEASLEPAGILNCAMVGALARWIDEVVQKEAVAYLGEPVTALRNVSSYVCRMRASGARMSEHARANAQDIAAFRTRGGVWIDVESHWGTNSKEGRFLWAVHQGACAHFTTVLGPDADAAHVNHFHVDLAQRRGGYRLCQ